LKRLLVFALFAGSAVLILPTCRSTQHTVARIVTPAPAPTEAFVPAEPTPTAPPVARPATAAARPAAPIPSPTPTAASMPVVTAPPASGQDRAPGVLYEQYVPTVVVVTPATTPISTRAVSPRSTRPPRTPTPAVTQKPGVYYEDPEGRPLTPTPQS
jgi:hypothetical protein